MIVATPAGWSKENSHVQNPCTAGPQPLWGVPDAKSAFERLLALGATELEPVTDIGEGIKVAAVKDPFGNRLGIIENPHFKGSEIR